MPSSAWSHFSHTQSTPLRMSSQASVDRPAVLVGEVDRVDQLAVDVELELVGGAVADPHGAGAAVALEVVELLFGELRLPSTPYMICSGRRLRTRPPGSGRSSQSMNAGASSVNPSGGARTARRRRRESTCSGSPSCARRRAARAGCRGGGDDRAGRLVRQQLQRQRRAVHRLAPAAAVWDCASQRRQYSTVSRRAPRSGGAPTGGGSRCPATARR